MAAAEPAPNAATDISQLALGSDEMAKKKKAKSHRVARSDDITNTMGSRHEVRIMTPPNGCSSLESPAERRNRDPVDHDADDGTTTTDDISSGFISTGDTSLLNTEDEEEYAAGVHQAEAASLYSPSHYPATSVYPGARTGFVDDGATLNSTRSLASVDIEYTWENGRRYCGSYYMPNDDEEQVRLLLMDEVYKKAFDGELTSVPLDNPALILDIGTGTGEWAIDMAMKYPNCEVIGSDISDIFSRPEPVNVIWEIDDAEQEWVRPPNHDLVHLRHMTGSFTNWPFIYEQAFRVLKPGGYIELLDFDDHKGFKNFFSFFQPNSLMHRVARDLMEASILSGRLRGVSHLEPRLLYDAGFEDVRISEYAIPLSPKESSTGHIWLKAITTGMEATVLRLLTTYKGWTAEEVRIAVAMIAEEMTKMALDPKRRKEFGVKVRVLTGRKPREGESLYSQTYSSQPRTPDVNVTSHSSTSDTDENVRTETMDDLVNHGADTDSLMVEAAARTDGSSILSTVLSDGSDANPYAEDSSMDICEPSATQQK